MGHGFHHAQIGGERGFNQFFAVAGGGHAGHLQAGVPLVQLHQLLADQLQRLAQVGLIVGVQDAALVVDHHQLDGGGAGVNADVHRPAVGPEGHAGHAGLHVAGVELLVLLLRGKQRGLAGVGGGGAVLVQRGDDLGQAEFLIGIERRAQRHVQKAVFGA